MDVRDWSSPATENFLSTDGNAIDIDRSPPSPTPLHHSLLFPYDCNPVSRYYFVSVIKYLSYFLSASPSSLVVSDIF